MHPTAQIKLNLFLQFCAERGGSGSRTVLDVGARQYPKDPGRTGSKSRSVCERLGLKYVGLDISAGINVDLVVKHTFIWRELADESIDYVVSTSTFEHNPFFWVTFAEVARVLKQGGKALITAPAAGHVHRYPVDCWRFYPDSWGALCALTGLAIEEVLLEPEQSLGVMRGAQWWDSSIVAAKPVFETSDAQIKFHERLRPLVAPYESFGPDFQPVEVNKGRLFDEYQAFVAKEVEKRNATPSEKPEEADWLRNAMRSAMRTAPKDAGSAKHRDRVD